MTPEEIECEENYRQALRNFWLAAKGDELQANALIPKEKASLNPLRKDVFFGSVLSAKFCPAEKFPNTGTS